jgi:glycosyltransferase involved in cell wall biosynthesis
MTHANQVTVGPNRAPFSVLMSVYRNDRPEWFQLAMDSICEQTLLPVEMVLVVDGPIPDTLSGTVNSFEGRDCGFELKVVRLEENGGLANAMNAGLRQCTQPFIARMDADDYSLPTRFELQAAVLRDQPEIGLICSWQGEFADNYLEMNALKMVAEHHDELISQLKWRNVIPHSSVVMDREAVEKVGGYRSEFGLVEDYDLFTKLALVGVRMHCVQEPVYRMRVLPEQRARRGGLSYIPGEWKFRHQLYTNGFITQREFLVSSTAYTVFRLSPTFLKTLLYRTVRSQPKLETEERRAA